MVAPNYNVLFFAFTFSVSLTLMEMHFLMEELFLIM
jgi:hypothetical protein